MPRHKAVAVATKLTPPAHKEADHAARAVGISMADLLRIGLSRVIAEFRATGKITLSNPTKP